MISIREATIEDIPVIQSIAWPTWTDTYTSILSSEQLDYMLHTIYAPERLQKEISAGSLVYLLFYNNDQPLGFASYGPRAENQDVYKLYKLYFLSETQGKGFGKVMINEIEERIKAQGKNILELNVNKYNSAKSFYEKMGFEVVYEEDIPIGDFWMNDYVMRKFL